MNWQHVTHPPQKQRPGFLQGVMLAAILAFVASVLMVSVGPLLGVSFLIRLLIPLLSLVYILYLLSRSRERSGRVTTLVLWSMLSILTWWFAPSVMLVLFIHAGSVWFIRSLYFHSSMTAALIDFGLSGLSLATAVWAISRSGSLFLATWCFFLIQSLFAAIPQETGRKPDHSNAALHSNQAFDRSRKDAEQALQQLFSR